MKIAEFRKKKTKQKIITTHSIVIVEMPNIQENDPMNLEDLSGAPWKNIQNDEEILSLLIFCSTLDSFINTNPNVIHNAGIAIENIEDNKDIE